MSAIPRSALHDTYQESQITTAFKGLTKRLPREKGSKKGLLFRPDLTADSVVQLRAWKVEKNRKKSLKEGKKKAAAGIPLAREIAGLAITLKGY
ncbi:MAG TPA: hypothetical protein VHV10_01085 [Ktedonobacteraceae bacterium]|nr:hypothetical protein [Ktedonobacteraceae bacterium]